MLLKVSVEELFTAIIYFSAEKQLIEKVELTNERLDNAEAILSQELIRDISQYFIEYFKNVDNKKYIYRYIDLSLYSEFCKSVYLETTKIPYGDTITYGELARRISRPKAVRAVGQCLSKNRYPLIIPCHRVVGKKDLGGFKYGSELKERIINREKFS